MQSANLLFWNWFAVFYITLALFLLTLIPFNFAWLAAAQHLKWNIEFQDVIQNLFLFFPLGAVLAHALPRSFIIPIIYGAFLSTAIEVIQLSDIGRTSNYCDIIANTAGTLMGLIYYRYLVSIRYNETLYIPLIFMIMPLCWFLAMRSATQDFMAWLVAPFAIIALSTFKIILYNNRLKWVILLIWLIFALMPLIYISRNVLIFSLFNFKITSGMLIFVSVALIICKVSNITKVIQYCFWSILLISVLFIIAVNLE
jgi:glycopeptide antibiotics resistance protein